MSPANAAKDEARGIGMSEQRRSNFIIRADGNARIASGHLRRTLSIAAQLLRLGCRVSYVLADAESEAMLLSQMADAGIGPDKIRRYVLGVSYGNPGGELPKLTDILRQSGAEALLTDSYAVDGAYFHALREAGDWYLAYIDDFGRFDPAADLVVNYDPLPDPARYRAAGKALLGPAYAPLREQFMDLRPEVRPEVGRILITTGGTDPFGMAGRMAELIREDPVLSEAGCRTSAFLRLDMEEQRTWRGRCSPVISRSQPAARRSMSSVRRACRPPPFRCRRIRRCLPVRWGASARLCTPGMSGRNRSRCWKRSAPSCVGGCGMLLSAGRSRSGCMASRTGAVLSGSRKRLPEAGVLRERRSCDGDNVDGGRN